MKVLAGRYPVLCTGIGFRRVTAEPEQLSRQVTRVQDAAGPVVDSGFVELPTQIRGIVGGPAVGPGKYRGRGTPLLIHTENAMPKRASGYSSYPIGFVSCQRERPVDGACHEVHKLIGIHLGTTVGSGFETIKELGLGAADVISHPIVEGGPHRGRSYVYCQD
jgi:hypothetical protein